MYKTALILCVFSVNHVLVLANYYVLVSTDAPVVRGATAQFTATLYRSDGSTPSGSFKYDWKDNAIPSHSTSHESESIADTWNVTYSADYPPGPYEVQIVVSRYYLVFYEEITSLRYVFNITETLNGGLAVVQKNETMKHFVMNSTAKHKIVLSKPDEDFISKNATSVMYYWFIDCIYYGPTAENEFIFNYTQPEEDHIVEALMVAGFEPITTPAPTTTTTTTTVTPKTTTITPSTTTTTKPTSTTKSTPTTTTKPSSVTTSKTTTTKPTITSSTHTNNNEITALPPKIVVKRDLTTNQTKTIMTKINNTLVPYNGSFPFVCLNNTIAPNPKKTYGYFSHKITIKAPVTKISVSGSNWLQHSELLALSVKCDGSKTFKYCTIFKVGVHNVTQNETCQDHEVYTKDTCEFNIQRYLSEATKHTVIIIISNDVSKIVQPVMVTVYKVQKQAQLSIIVVPVVSSLVAIVLIIFGVAYYFQNRSRFIVEVADFNFGQNYSDMEYKTFRERLRDSIVNAFTRAPSPSSSDVPVWPPGRKYGSMT